MSLALLVTQRPGTMPVATSSLAVWCVDALAGRPNTNHPTTLLLLVVGYSHSCIIQTITQHWACSGTGHSGWLGGWVGEEGYSTASGGVLHSIRMVKREREKDMENKKREGRDRAVQNTTTQSCHPRVHVSVPAQSSTPPKQGS
jgi:hypothetical protein